METDSTEGAWERMRFSLGSAWPDDDLAKIAEGVLMARCSW